MFKLVANDVWAFDAEWVPDPVSGRAALDLPSSMSDVEVIEAMWKHGGATEENPKPYLKTVLCRVVSVACVTRKCSRPGDVRLALFSLPEPKESPLAEGALIERFLSGIGKSKPQLVGFNSISADVMILVQRGVVNGLRIPEFCKRPDKPWEGNDYFARSSDWNVDLREELGGFGRTVPTLHEIATACGIPGKIGVSGDSVVDLWSNGEIRRIVQYNEWDALTTYLLWLRTAHFAGFLTTGEYQAEQDQLEQLLIGKSQAPENDHLPTFLERWRTLRRPT